MSLYEHTRRLMSSIARNTPSIRAPTSSISASILAYSDSLLPMSFIREQVIYVSSVTGAGTLTRGRPLAQTAATPRGNRGRPSRPKAPQMIIIEGQNKILAMMQAAAKMRRKPVGRATACGTPRVARGQRHLARGRRAVERSAIGANGRAAR